MKKDEIYRENYNKLMRQGRAFVGSIKILEAKNIKPSAKVLFFLISSLSFKTGYCFAQNKTLREKMNIGETMLRQYLEALEENNYIIIKRWMTTRGWRKNIYINFKYLLKETEQTEHNSTNNGKIIQISGDETT